MTITYTDIFCGAGGSSIGLTEAGLQLRLAANHWDRAIETHSTNFPDAEHLCADVSNYDMRRLPRTDVLWASPECTWHSPAGGRKRVRAQLDLLDDYVPTDGGIRSRATAFDVIRAAEVHRYRVVIVENVVEFADWPLFGWWLDGMRKLDYHPQVISVSIEHAGGAALIVCPLGVRHEFARDAAMLGLTTRFVRRSSEVDGPGLYLTNYESVRDGKLDPGLFTAASLDEASVLRSYGSKTYQVFTDLFRGVPYRFVATATPSPNRYKELIHYAGFLGVMDTGQALTRFFQRDSTKANHLTLYPHKEHEFWLWLNTWAIFLQKPSDLGYITFVDPAKVRPKRDPGRCFLRAGFHRAGHTQGGLVVLQILPDAMPSPAPASRTQLGLMPPPVEAATLADWPRHTGSRAQLEPTHGRRP